MAPLNPFGMKLTGVHNYMTKKNHRTIFGWTLWTGLAIWVVSLAGIMLSPSAESNQALTEFTFENGWAPALLVIGLLLPCLEEVAFRFWGIRRWRWAGYISAVAMGVVTYFYWGLWGALATTAVAAAVTLAVKAERTRLLILLLLTSLLFAILHFDNYGNLELRNLFAIFNKLGFALVASWLVLNRGFLWALVLHVVINSLLVLLIALPLGETHIPGLSINSGEGWTIFAHCLDNDEPRYSNLTPVYTGTMASIGADLLRMADSNATANAGKNGSRWEMVIYRGDGTVGVGNDSTQVKPLALLRAMEQNQWISLDTISLYPMQIAVSEGKNTQH